MLALFVGVGIFYVDSANWTPFAPNGWQGIHQGAAIVFFAFIGFDAVSTAAEETKDPQRSMPIGILGSLAICTLIYVVVGGIATGLVPYTDLKGSDPLARAFELRGVRWMHLVLALGAVISMTAVLLVFQLGQTRIFFSMSRDGLLPSWFRRIHPRYGTPFATTIWTGVIVAVLSSVLDDDETYDLTNIGTLFAFLVVCLGVLALRIKEPDRPRPFRVPFRVGGRAARSGVVHLRDDRPARPRPGCASGSGWGWEWSSTSPSATGTAAWSARETPAVSVLPVALEQRARRRARVTPAGRRGRRDRRGPRARRWPDPRGRR